MAVLVVFERLVKPIPTQYFRLIVFGFFVVGASFTAWHDAYLSLNGREADLRLANNQLAIYRANPTPPQILFSPNISVPTAAASPLSNDDLRRWEKVNKALEDRRNKDTVSNKALYDRVVRLTTRMRQLQSEYNTQIINLVNNNYVGQGSKEQNDAAWHQYNELSLRLYYSFRDSFSTTMLAEAMFCRDEMLVRLNNPHSLPSEMQHVSRELESGIVAGASPLNQYAAYLEFLAKQLPLN